VDEARPTPRPIVLCPLRFEREALQAFGLAAVCDLVQTGPGAEAIVRWAEAFGESSRLVILAGLAGSLRPTLSPGTAAVVTSVVDERGRAHPSALGTGFAAAAPGAGVSRAIAASSPHALITPAEREAFAVRTGADLVDQESASFVLVGAILGWRWAIVRGISDGCADRLPNDIDRWVDQRGETRLGRVLWSLARRPWLVPRIFRLSRTSRLALQRVAAVAFALAASAAPSPAVDWPAAT
jgi:adenosylhomocysteine nucleosidase